MIPEGWQVQNLADVALIILGQSPPSSACNEKVKGYPFYQGNADFGYRHPLPQRWIEKPLKIAQKDDILISVRAPVGELNIANTDCCIGRGVGSIRPLSANRNFIYYTLLNARNSLASVSQGSTFDAINGKELRSLSLLIPPLPEQMKIAAILSSVDDAIQATQAVIDQTRRVKQGLMQQLLTRGIGHTRFKQTEIGEIPEDWGVAKLDDVCEWIGVGIASSTTHAYAKDGIPIIRNQNIKEGYIDSSNLLRINLEFDQNNKTKRIRTGDVLSVRTGYPGLSAVVPPEFDQCHCFTTLISRPNINILKPEYLCWWINSDCGKRFVLSGQAGGAQQNFNVGELRKMPLAIPPKDEQQRIAGIIEDMLRMIQMYEKDIESIITLKKGLMQDLLTGRVRVKLEEEGAT